MKYWTVVKGGELDRILGSSAEDEVAGNLLADERLVEGRYPSDQFYVDTQGQISPRKGMNISLSIAPEEGVVTLNEGDILSIGNLPEAAQVKTESLAVEHKGVMALISGMAESGQDHITIQAPDCKTTTFLIRQRHLAAVIDRLCAAVDAERDRRAGQPVLYKGHLFDAGAVSLAAIRGWQAQIAAGSPVPADFVWRDANNISHPAGAEFINGLGAALSVLDFKLRKAAWAHKQAIRALSIVSDVDAYDMSHNWPSELA